MGASIARPTRLNWDGRKGIDVPRKGTARKPTPPSASLFLLADAARPPGVYMPSPVRFQFPSLVHLFLLSKTWRLLLLSRVLQVEGLDAYGLHV